MRREHNGTYVIKDTITKQTYKGTLKELVADTGIPMSTIVQALDSDRLIYRRFKVSFKG